MKNPAEIIKDILVAASVGQFNTGAWPIVLAHPPDTSDQAVICNITPGGRSPFPQFRINFPSVQVMVRGAKNGYQAAYIKAVQVMNACLGISQYVDAGTGDKLQSCTQIGDISYLGQDDNTRPLFSLNFSLIILPVESTAYRQPLP